MQTYVCAVKWWTVDEDILVIILSVFTTAAYTVYNSISSNFDKNIITVLNSYYLNKLSLTTILKKCIPNQMKKLLCKVKFVCVFYLMIGKVGRK